MSDVSFKIIFVLQGFIQGFWLGGRGETGGRRGGGLLIQE